MKEREKGDHVAGVLRIARDRGRRNEAFKDVLPISYKPAAEGFRNVRAHDLKQTVGGRLRTSVISFEDRQDLLDHKSSRMPTHYSAMELANLIEATDKALEKSPHDQGFSRGTQFREILSISRI